MSILMSSMPHFSHYDPFNAGQYSTTSLFDSQEHYLEPSTASPYSPSPYTTTPHPFPVDPRWFNTSFSAHAISAQHQFDSSMTHSVITPPQLETDLLSLSPSSTITPIPLLSGSRNRSSSMSNRIRSFNPSRGSRQLSSAGSAATTQRIARRSTVSSAATTSRTPTTLQSPVGGASSSYLHSPTLEEPNDGHEMRASKRRRTDDVDSASLQSYSTVPEPPHLLTPTQPPHLLHGYPSSQTWAGPPSAGHHLTHGHVSPDHHGYAQWPPAPLPYFTPSEQHHLGQAAVDHHHHHINDHGSQTPMLPYPSPTVAGPAFFNNSPEPESAVSSHFHFHKMEPDSPSPRLLEDVQPSFDSFEHGPTEFPPRAYPGGLDAQSPWALAKPVGKIFGSRLEQVSLHFILHNPITLTLQFLDASH